MASKDKLNKKQILAIPRLLKKNTIGGVAKKYNVSWQAIWYWINRLRKKGIKVETRKSGSYSKIF